MEPVRENVPGASIYTVSRLTGEIKKLLENRFPIIWVEGEISNFRSPASGHFYFTLKDSKAQIQAVMFAGQNRKLGFIPEDGMKITGLGRVSVYEPRGIYQVIFEHMMPKGVGELIAAFEQLKKKLEAEGLFDEKRKKPLPFIPSRVSVISSPTGAVIHDMINVMTRRFPGIETRIIPVPVQGENAADEIASALEIANQLADSDIIVIARGGGSLEDLAPFNTEIVARAIDRSAIPVVSAVGHETDFTICDFVADLRAPTPSAAAELIVPVKHELAALCAQLEARLVKGFSSMLANQRERLQNLSKRLVHPGRSITDALLKLDDITIRLTRALAREIDARREKLRWMTGRLTTGMPSRLLDSGKQRLGQSTQRLYQAMSLRIREDTSRVKGLSERLNALSPKAVLKRGYSITRRVEDNMIVKKSDQAGPGTRVGITLAEGEIECTVDG